MTWPPSWLHFIPVSSYNSWNISQMVLFVHFSVTENPWNRLFQFIFKNTKLLTWTKIKILLLFRWFNFRILCKKWVSKPNIPTNYSSITIFNLFFTKFGCSSNNMLLLLALINFLNVGIFQFITYISPLCRHNYFSFF